MAEHGHGWGERPSWLCGWKNYSTILHQIRNKNSRLLHYSNPDVGHNNHPTGVSTVSDNAAWISNGNGCAVAGYEAEPFIPLSADIWGEEHLCHPRSGQYLVSVTGSNSPYSYEWHISTDGANWGSVAGTGPSITVNSVNYPANKTVFLRIKVTDAVGTIVFAFFDFKILPSTSPDCFMLFQYIPKGNTTTAVSPNPANEKIKVAFKVNKEFASTSIQMYSITGIKLAGINRDLLAGEYVEEIPIEQIPAGPFFVQIWNGDTLHNQLIIKY